MPPTQWPTTSPKDTAISCRLVSDDELVWHGVPWKLAELLGSGRLASVYRLRKAASLPPDAQPQGGPEEVAAKVTRLPGLSPWARAQLAEEAIIWSSLSHPNVLQFYGTVANSTLHISLLEFARGGELFDRIVKMEDFSEANAADQVQSSLQRPSYLSLCNPTCPCRHPAPSVLGRLILSRASSCLTASPASRNAPSVCERRP